MATNPQPTSEPRKLTNRQFATLLGVPVMTVYYWRRKGKIAPRPEDGNFTAEHISAAKAWVAQSKIEATNNRRVGLVMMARSPAANEKRRETIAAKVKGIRPTHVAAMVGVHLSTLFRWWRQGKIPSRLPDGSVSKECVAEIRNFVARIASPEGRSERVAKGWTPDRRRHQSERVAAMDSRSRTAMLANLATGQEAAKKALENPEKRELWRANLSKGIKRSYAENPIRRRQASEASERMWAERSGKLKKVKILESLKSKPLTWRQIVPWLLLYPQLGNNEVQRLAGTSLTSRTITRIRSFCQIPGPAGRRPTITSIDISRTSPSVFPTSK